MVTCLELFEQLNSLDEHPQIDAKTASDVGPAVMKTICAFSDEPDLGGGYILLGVKVCKQPSKRKYCVIGVENPDKIQTDIATQCASVFNKVIRPDFIVEKLEGKTVIAIAVPEAQSGDKPIFIKKLGLPQGAFRRIGSTNQHCTEDDISELFQNKSVRPYDETIIPTLTIDDIDNESVNEYRKLRKEFDPSAEELRLNDSGLLESLNCLKRYEGILRPTVAGLILFGKSSALRRYFPMMRLDYIRVPGRKWIENPSHPLQTIEMRESLFKMIPRAQTLVMGDIPRAFSFTSERIEEHEGPRIPPRVILEALVNAVMHRRYTVNGTIQVIKYANRLEILNPGHSLKPIDRLGEPGSKTRNPNIAIVLHDTKYAENKGAGIRVMQELMETSKLSPPTFESDREKDQFKATFLLHHFLDRQDITWLSHFKDLKLKDDEAHILFYARELGYINNQTCRYFTKLDTVGASAILKRLRDIGLLEQHPRASATYYTPTELLLHPETQPKKQAEKQKDKQKEFQSVLPIKSDEITEGLKALPAKSTALPAKLSALPANLPANLISEIENLGRRSPPADIRSVIRKLCDVRAFTADDLAIFLQRNKEWISDGYLSPMIRDRILEYTEPSNPQHPRQAYRTRRQENENRE